MRNWIIGVIVVIIVAIIVWVVVASVQNSPTTQGQSDAASSEAPGTMPAGPDPSRISSIPL